MDVKGKTLGGQAAHIELAPAEYKKLLRKIDYHVIPMLTILYLLSFLDRGTWCELNMIGNIGNANVQGLSTSLGLVGNQYNWCLTIFFFPYSFTEPLCNLLLVRLKPSIWLPSIMVAWGIVTTLTGIVQSYTGLMVARFFLVPGLAFYVSLWYPHADAQFRLALIFASASMAGAFSGLLAYLIGMMDKVGGLEGWRWIFILEGMLTVIVAIISFFYVWDEPATANFLTDHEKEALLDALQPTRIAQSTNPQLGHGHSFKWKQVMAALLDWQAQVTADKMFCRPSSIAWDIGEWLACAVYALSLFLPTIIKGLGYTAAHAQLLTIPVYAAATIACISVGYFSDKTGKRSFFTFICYGAVMVGYLIAVAPAKFIPGLTYAGCFIAACGIYPDIADSSRIIAIPGLLVLSSNNWAPNGKRAVGMAIQMGFGTMGGAAASNFYRSSDAPRYRLGHILVLVFAVLGLSSMATYYIICTKVNAKREAEADRVLQYTDEELLDMGDKAPTYRYKL
ncbi:uncharacterized protein N7496_001581 [Penicillium cataractarum]|uniref:Major facilitator superfamily (MFS) profile domain-containing protein n=1 Tax=Penicillium cataractarum TaxID=2100454 RepID=A0A9X0B722_9EURO|nr:uncharacterized protein N7496_001581 [Penicillium cataractarum]KAJ5390513.1 hypothetical protein N7496_001581 [Penicillium cataractarum]